MVSEQDVEKLAAAARVMPPNANVYLEEDFVMKLLETVRDYMLQNEVVVRALERFRENRWSEVHTLDDLERLMARFPDDQAGNTALAQYLWGYNFWTRAQQLRELRFDAKAASGLDVAEPELAVAAEACDLLLEQQLDAVLAVESCELGAERGRAELVEQAAA
jgi:hypothetical protein